MDRRRSQGFQLPRVTDGQSTPVHNSMDGRNDPMHVYESMDMPTVEECRIRATQSQHGDGAEKVHHSHHHRTKHEREQFEDRLRTGQVTQKDIETLHGYLTLEKKEKNVLGDLDTADIEIDVTGRFEIHCQNDRNLCKKKKAEYSVKSVPTECPKTCKRIIKNFITYLLRKACLTKDIVFTGFA